MAKNDIDAWLRTQNGHLASTTWALSRTISFDRKRSLAARQSILNVSPSCIATVTRDE
jgi:hypothetical protein